MKRLGILLIFVTILCVSFGGIAVAQELRSDSNEVRTKVGNPPDKKAPEIDPSQLQHAIKSEFGISMEGYSTQHLQWIWEKLWEVSDTKFDDLIRGSRMVASGCVIRGVEYEYSCQVGCLNGEVSIYLKPYPTEDLFKFIFTHESGHILQYCSPVEARFQDIINASQTTEGAVSYYGQFAGSNDCPDATPANENYADVVAYYLNPNAGISSASCGGRAPVSPPNPFHGSQVTKPLQFNIIKNALGDFP